MLALLTTSVGTSGPASGAKPEPAEGEGGVDRVGDSQRGCVGVLGSAGARGPDGVVGGSAWRTAADVALSDGGGTRLMEALSAVRCRAGAVRCSVWVDGGG